MKTIRRVPSALAVVAFSLLVLAGPAGAQAVDGTTDPDAPVGAIITLDNTWVYLITALLLPFVIGLVTKDSMPGWVKVGLAGAIGTVATAFLELVQDDGSAIISQEFLLKAVVTVGSAMFAYGNVWKPIAQGVFNGERVGRIYPLPSQSPAVP